MARPGLDGAAVDYDGGAVVSDGGHEAAGHVFVAAGEGDVAVVVLGHYHLCVWVRVRVSWKE